MHETADLRQETAPAHLTEDQPELFSSVHSVAQSASYAANLNSTRQRPEQTRLPVLPEATRDLSAEMLISALANEATGNFTDDAPHLTATESSISSPSAVYSSNSTRKAKPTVAARQCPALVVPHNYHPDGHPQHNHAQAHIVHSQKSQNKPPEERVLIVAANSGGSCGLQLGDYYTFLSMLDKLQYGNLHGYDVLLGMGNIDPALLATWNKVGWMLKVR